MSKRATIPTPPPQLDHRSEQQPYRRDMEAIYADTRIVKRLSATQPGALKLARRYGDALVCVRVTDTIPITGTATPRSNSSSTKRRCRTVRTSTKSSWSTLRSTTPAAGNWPWPKAPGGTPVVGYGPCHDESPRSFVCRPESSKTEANNVARNICSPRHILATCKKHRTNRTNAMAAYGNSKWQLFAIVGALPLAAGIWIDV